MNKTQKKAHAKAVKKWALKNKDKVKEITRRSKLKNWEKNMWLCAKNNAKTMNRQFNIEVSDIIIPKFCPLLGIKLTREIGKGRVGSNPSIDRIDNSKGYIKGNIRVVSEKANRIKMDLSIKELVLLAHNILKIHA